jgi:hypothetical protein
MLADQFHQPEYHQDFRLFHIKENWNEIARA